jgi:hypothetical protein
MTYKPIYYSKKFVAAMTWNIMWLLLIGTGIKSKFDTQVLLAMIYAAGVTQVLYLGGQSLVDALVRVAEAKYTGKPVSKK